MTLIERIGRYRTAVLALALAAGASLAVLASGSWAQGLDAEGAVDAIIGSDVQTDEVAGADEAERIIAAIENVAEAAAEVRKRFNLGEVALILLTDLDEPGNPVAEAIEEHLEAIQALRVEIEGSAMFYHAIDSNNVLLQNVIALEFHDEDVIIFAVGGGAVR